MTKKSKIISVLSALSVIYATAAYSTAQNFSVPSSITPEGSRTLSNLWDYINEYRQANGGGFPSSTQELLSFLLKEKKTAYSVRMAIGNSDAVKLGYTRTERSVTYTIFGARPNGQPFSSPSRKGDEDIVAYTDIYFKGTSSDKSSPQGGYLTLTSKGLKQFSPYDTVFYEDAGDFYEIRFLNQSGIKPLDTLSYSEMEINSNHPFPKLGKPSPNNSSVAYDNGGPESLLQLSRRERFPNVYGIDRESLWRTFDPTQTEFTLLDVQSGAEKLGLETQVQRLSLSQLQASGAPALLFLKDDGRIVTLTSLDENRAVIVDRGQTRNVERSVLEDRYSGEALVPIKALTRNTTIVVDDAVRSIQLPSLDAEVTQRFTLRNTGTAPVTLQLEDPLLGVTDSKLSQDTLAPDETATLDLKFKWRTILKAPTQNVLVSLQTNDPNVPRLQLAILLNPPKVALQ